MGNWIDCVRSRKTPNASAEIGFRSAIAVHMANLAYRHQKCHPDSEGVTLKTVPAIPSYCSLFAVRWLVERFSRRYQYARNLGLVLGRLAQAVVLVFGPLVVATVVAPSFHTSDLVQVLGIGGIAIAFAFRDILQNFLAGVLFLLHEPFRLSDQIKVGRV